jgi:hypothetical protein
MGRPESDSEFPASRSRFGSSGNRRTFLKRAIGGLAIAVPAFQILSGAAPAAAATPASSPQSCVGVCTPNKLLAVYCADEPNGSSCNGPDVEACMEEWERPNGSVYEVQDGYCFEP